MLPTSTLSNKSFIDETDKYFWRSSEKSIHLMRVCLTIEGHEIHSHCASHVTLSQISLFVYIKWLDSCLYFGKCICSAHILPYLSGVLVLFLMFSFVIFCVNSVMHQFNFCAYSFLYFLFVHCMHRWNNASVHQSTATLYVDHWLAVCSVLNFLEVFFLHSYFVTLSQF